MVDFSLVHPFTIRYNGRQEVTHTLLAESEHARAEWKEKLEEAVSLKPNKVFELKTLSFDTFVSPPAVKKDTGLYTGPVSSSVPFGKTLRMCLRTTKGSRRGRKTAHCN